MPIRIPRARALAALLACAAGPAAAFDHALTPSDAGIWARRDTLALEYGVVATELGGALWLGGQDPLGRTFWRTLDSSAATTVAAQALKWTFGRERPSQSADPGLWFHGLKYQSFPSGEVALQASFVTPFVAEYGASNPWVWALEILPAYDAAARVKEGGHWQSDVLAGWALGTGIGWLAARREQPFFLQVLPHGVGVGFRTRF